MAGTLAAFNCRRRGRVSRPCANESPKATADIIGDSIIVSFYTAACTWLFLQLLASDCNPGPSFNSRNFDIISPNPGISRNFCCEPIPSFQRLGAHTLRKESRAKASRRARCRSKFRYIPGNGGYQSLKRHRTINFARFSLP